MAVITVLALVFVFFPAQRYNEPVSEGGILLQLLDDEFESYDDLAYEKINGTRFRMWDKKLEKEMQFNLKGIDFSKYLPPNDFHVKLESMNDYKYTAGYGFYLDGYAEFGIYGFMEGEDNQTTFEKEKTYRFGQYEFKVSPPTDLFRYLTWNDDESKAEFDTIKLTSVTKDSFVVDIEKALLYIGTRFKEDIEEEYGEFQYPGLLDLREVGMLYEPFDYTAVSLELDWHSPVLGNVALFNQGESTSNYNFFAYYRFMETFFDDGNELDQLIGLVESVNSTILLEFAKENNLIEDSGTKKSLARALYEVRNNYIHHKLHRVRTFDPTHNIPVPVLAKWRVVTKEIAIQLLNIHGK